MRGEVGEEFARGVCGGRCMEVGVATQPSARPTAPLPCERQIHEFTDRCARVPFGRRAAALAAQTRAIGFDAMLQGLSSAGS